MNDHQNLYGLFAVEIGQAIAPLGMPAYRGLQIAEWMYRRGVTKFADMINLPAAQRKKLSDRFFATEAIVEAEQHSVNSNTTKYLLAYQDGQAVETVLMRQHYGNSVCVSTQVGCAMGCVFCASTIGGMIRDLSAGEILAQVQACQQRLSPAGQKVNSIVIMGAGEPLLNYQAVLRFIRLCHESYVLGLSYRSFTLSTSGIVPGIYNLAMEGLPITLAISLHAPDDSLRSKLMPINKRYPIKEVLEAADHYAKTTGRRVTFEYILIKGINDEPAHALELAALLKARLANVNLIPINTVPERGLHRPSQNRVEQFANLLTQAGIQNTVRREMGNDIQAACGQLRQQNLQNNPPC